MNFSGGSDGRASAYNAGYLGSIPGSGRSPIEGHGNPLQYSSLENSRGQRILAGYSPWGRKESDKIEQLRTAQSVGKKLNNSLSERLFVSCQENFLPINVPDHMDI